MSTTTPSPTTGSAGPDEGLSFKDKIKTIQWHGYRYSLRGFARDNIRRNEAELNAYAQSRKDGNQPDGTKMKQIEAANRFSDRTGRAYRGEDRAHTFHPELAEALLGKAPVKMNDQGEMVANG